MDHQAALRPIAALIGTWAGEGTGKYPTIEDFSYTEELTFSDIGKPFLHYVQRTWADDGRPLHVETGYLRAPTASTVEFTLAQPTGQVELAEGQLLLDGGLEMELRGRILNSASAKQVDATVRCYRLDGDHLVTSFDMAAVGESMTRHLDSRLTRSA